MIKQEYINFMDSKLWEFEDLLYNKEDAPLHFLGNVDLKVEDYIEFSKNYFDLCEQDWEQEKSYYTKEGNFRAKLNILLGYNKSNSFVLNFGKKGNTNEVLKEIFGNENFEKLNLIPETVLFRLIVKLPGHGFPFHVDDASSYKQKFSEHKDKAVRLWIPISSWADGHMFQIADKVITHWNSGDTYQIPWGITHLGVNYGFKPQLTLSITGCTHK